MKQFFAVCALLAFLALPAGAQSFDVWVVGTVNGTNLDVEFYIASTSTDFIPGTSSFVLNKDDAELGTPTKLADGTWGAGSDGDYSLRLSKGTGYGGLTIEFSGDDDMTGPAVTTSAAYIGTLRFPILDAAATAQLTWRGILVTTQVTKLLNPGSDITWTEITASGSFLPPSEMPLPITLSSFAGKVAESGHGVQLTWRTQSEVNNYGFTVQRKLQQDDAFVDVPNAFIEGKGTTVDPQDYSFTDTSVPAAGTYAYRLKQQDLDGTVHYTQSVIVVVTLTDVAETAPREFRLLQNYPNPFNPSTMLKFAVPATGQATMKVYNTLGAEVATLYDGMAEAGRYYAVTFDAAGMSSGVYFYRLTTEQKTEVRRMLLMK